MREETKIRRMIYLKKKKIKEIKCTFTRGNGQLKRISFFFKNKTF